MKFKAYFESKDIFGFDKQPSIESKSHEDLLEKPINQFDVELMMDFLHKKTIGHHVPVSRFISEVQWGSQPGAVKLEIDTGLSFYIKRLGMDKTGNPRWVTKKIYQLNRNGYGGTEDAVSQEIFEHLEKHFKGQLDTPVNEDYKDLDKLVHHIYGKLKRSAKDIFIPEGIKKINDDAYLLCLGVRGQGVEGPGHQRIEQNQTMIAYDKNQGTIRIFNYNIESPVGKGHSWKLSENDLDIYFFPSQSRDEIADCLEVHFKYY